MPGFRLLDFSAVRTAIAAVQGVAGGYEALDLLTRAMMGSESPPEFEVEKEQLEARLGPSYEGPEESAGMVLQALHTAADAPPAEQEALLKLVALVIRRLGVYQGSRAVTLTLMACGLHPALAGVVVQLCLLLARTEAGRRILQQTPVDAWRVLLARGGSVSRGVTEMLQACGAGAEVWIGKLLQVDPVQARAWLQGQPGLQEAVRRSSE